MASRTGIAVGVLTMLGLGGVLAAKAVAAPKGPDLPPPALPSPSQTPPGWTYGSFPLGIGQTRSMLVKVLQEALLARGGAVAEEIRKSGGADGDFGPGTSRALKAFGAPSTTSVTEPMFRLIVSNPTATPGTSGDSTKAPVPPVAAMTVTKTPAQLEKLEERLKTAVVHRNAPNALAVLTELKTPGDYNALNAGGAGIRFYNSFAVDLVRTTIVTKLLETFPGDSRFPSAFSMIGLVKGANGNWALPSGVAGLGAIPAFGGGAGLNYLA